MRIRVLLLGVVALGLLSVTAACGADQPEPRRVATFGDRMQPYAAPSDSGSVSAVHRTESPDWGPSAAIGWESEGAFTYSLTPRAIGSYTRGAGEPALELEAAEFYAGNAVPKNADVTFTVTARRFAIRYLTFGRSDAMVWIDGKQVSAEPFTRNTRSRDGADDWIVVSWPERRTAEVRFAGPLYFAGVEHPADEDVTVRASEPPFTLGVVSDSYYEPSIDEDSMWRSAAPTLATLTGFRVWSMAQGGTGYLNDGSDPIGETFDDIAGTSPFTSANRIQAIGQAPLDALLVNGSVNDVDFPAAEHRRAVDAFLTAVEAQAPTLPIVLVGLEPLSTAKLPDRPTERFTAMTRTLEEMAEEHPNVVGFIDPYTPNWLTGTGSTAEPSGSGNQDRYIGVDGHHPNGAGQVFYQKKIVAELRKLPIDPLVKRR